MATTSGSTLPNIPVKVDIADSYVTDMIERKRIDSIEGNELGNRRCESERGVERDKNNDEIGNRRKQVESSHAYCVGLNKL